jgi:hypothetical protein
MWGLCEQFLIKKKVKMSNKKCIMTVVTENYYQYYIPIFIWSALNTWRDADIKIYLRGELNSDVKDALCIIGKSYPEQNRFEVIQWYKTDYPYLPSTTNSLRFTTEKLDYDEVLVTDIDFFFCKMPQDTFRWFMDNRDNYYFSGTHGPWERPPRPKICPSWRGDFERVAGGFFMIYPDWWEKTKTFREHNDQSLKKGLMGDYRENDEVMLFRMIRDAGLPVPKKVPFPRFLRHLHLGDFKPQMKTRYENSQKMFGLLDQRCVNQFLRTKTDPIFSKILDIVCRNTQMSEIIERTIVYCERTKKR